MLIYKIHKWLFSFALLASVVSFSSFIVYTETPVGSPTELLLVEKPVSKTAIYYFGIINSNNKHSFNFSFKTFLKKYNSTHSLKFKTIKEQALRYSNYIHFKVFTNSIKQDYYHKIFIG